MAGVDIRTVAELMGHTSIQQTMRYAHLGQSHKAAAVERLADAGQLEAASDTRSDTSDFRDEQQRDGDNSEVIEGVVD